jgi:hypothetical protein
MEKKIISDTEYNKFKKKIREAIGNEFFPEDAPYNAARDMKDDTLAHYAAYLNVEDRAYLPAVRLREHRKTRLPASFDGWGMVGKRKITVAEAVARCSVLPEDFNQWLLGDKNTVLHSLAAGHPKDLIRRIEAGKISVSMLNTKGKAKKTVAMLMRASMGGHSVRLPDEYDGWLQEDCHGVIAARYHLKNGLINNNFKDWNVETIFDDGFYGPNHKCTMATVAGLDVYEIPEEVLLSMHEKNALEYILGLKEATSERALELVHRAEIMLNFDEDKSLTVSPMDMM